MLELLKIRKDSGNFYYNLIRPNGRRVHPFNLRYEDVGLQEFMLYFAKEIGIDYKDLNEFISSGFPSVSSTSKECIVETNGDSRLPRATFKLKGKKLPDKKVVIFGRASNDSDLITVSELYPHLQNVMKGGIVQLYITEPLKNIHSDCLFIGLNSSFRNNHLLCRADMEKLIEKLIGGKIIEKNYHN